MIVSAAHDYHCKYQKGDYLNLLSAINKQVSTTHWPNEHPHTEHFNENKPQFP